MTVFISVIPSLGIKTWEEAGFLIYRGMISALLCGRNPGRAVSTNHCQFFALIFVYINVDVSGEDHIKRGEIVIGQHVLPGMSSVWVTLGQQKNPFESKSFRLKPLLLLFNEKVITYMKTVIWQCCVCVQHSSSTICWATGLLCEFLPVNKSFSPQGFITGTAGTWECQR